MGHLGLPVRVPTMCAQGISTPVCLPLPRAASSLGMESMSLSKTSCAMAPESPFEEKSHHVTSLLKIIPK